MSPEDADSSAGRAASCLRSSRRAMLHAVHLVGAVGEAQRAEARRTCAASGKSSLTPPPPWAWMARSITRSAMFGHDHLDGRDLDAGALVADGVHQPGRLQREQAGLLDLDAGVGDPLLDHALLGQRLAEGDPARHPPAHQLEGPLGHADAAHAVVDAARAEAGLGDGEAAALLAEQVGDGHPHVVEADLAVALRSVVAEHRQVAHDGHAGRVQRHEDHRLLEVAGRRRGRSCP